MSKLLIILWIICSILAYGITNAYSQEYGISMTSTIIIGNCLLGPLALITIAISLPNYKKVKIGSWEFEII